MDLETSNNARGHVKLSFWTIAIVIVGVVKTLFWEIPHFGIQNCEKSTFWVLQRRR